MYIFLIKKKNQEGTMIENKNHEILSFTKMMIEIMGIPS